MNYRDFFVPKVIRNYNEIKQIERENPWSHDV